MSVLGKRRLSGKSDPPPKKCKTNPFIPPLINLHVSSDDKQWTITVAQGTDISSKIAGLCHMNPHQFKCVDERGDPVLLSSYNLSDNTRVFIKRKQQNTNSNQEEAKFDKSGNTNNKQEARQAPNKYERKVILKIDFPGDDTCMDVTAKGFTNLGTIFRACAQNLGIDRRSIRFMNDDMVCMCDKDRVFDIINEDWDTNEPIVIHAMYPQRGS
eukprot:8127_1